MNSCLKPYPEMKDTGMEWLGPIPMHWEVASLGRFGSFSTGRGGNRLDEDPAGVPCIRYGDLYTTHRRFVVESKSFVPRMKAREYTPIRFGDVLFAATGETAEEIGESAVNLIRSEACCGSDVIRFRPHRTVDPRYLGYATDCLPAASQKAVMGRKITVAHIYADQLKSLTVTLPPLSEQGAIVRFLERVERRIQKFILAKRKIVALLEEQRTATIHRVLTGQIDARTGRPYRSYKKSGVAWLGNVPEHWILERLKSSMANIEEPCAERRQYDACVALEHVESWTGRLGYADLDTPPRGRMKRFAPGDVLFGKLRPYLARVACPPTKGLCVSEFLVLRPRRSAFSTRYVERLLRSKPVVEAVDNLTCGARVPRAEWRSIGHMKIVRPPLPEQTAIVGYLEKAVARIDECVARANRQIDLVTEYRARLVADVVTGKHDVRGTPVALVELFPNAIGGDLDDALDIEADPELDEASPCLAANGA